MGLELELFLNQNCPESHQLTRMVVTHTIHAHTHTQKKKKEGGGETSEKVGKTASLMNFYSLTALHGLVLYKSHTKSLTQLVFKDTV